MTRDTAKKLVLAYALLAIAAPLAAQANSEDGWRQDRTWLKTRGPDAEGNYIARISLSDLDLTSEDGSRQMDRRIKSGIRWTCWLMSSDPRNFSGSPSETECRNKSFGQAWPQIELALQSARRGEQVTILNLGGRHN